MSVTIALSSVTKDETEVFVLTLLELLRESPLSSILHSGVLCRSLKERVVSSVLKRLSDEVKTSRVEPR